MWIEFVLVNLLGYDHFVNANNKLKFYYSISDYILQVQLDVIIKFLKTKYRNLLKKSQKYRITKLK